MYVKYCNWQTKEYGVMECETRGSVPLTYLTLPRFCYLKDPYTCSLFAICLEIKFLKISDINIVENNVELGRSEC